MTLSVAEMRRFTLTLLAALAIAPAALAAARATGDGALSVVSANGTITIVGKGTIYGQIDSGTLSVTDPDPTDGTVQVNGAEHTHPKGGNLTIYVGKAVTFRLVGGRYKLVLSGTGIDFLAVGVGKATLRGVSLTTSNGTFTVDGAKARAIPGLPAVPPVAGTTWPGVIVPFGVQPTAPAP